jgi:hypothetical protein
LQLLRELLLRLLLLLLLLRACRLLPALCTVKETAAHALGWMLVLLLLLLRF